MSIQRYKFITLSGLMGTPSLTSLPQRKLKELLAACKGASVFDVLSSASFPRTMKELEQELDPKLFVRVHRSAIVNVHTIAKLQMLANGEHQLMLTNGQAVKVSRSYKDRVKQVFNQ